jgi:predicted Zn-dependent peptidase
MSSRLFQVIREDLGLAYSIYSNPSFFEDTGDLVVSAGLDADNLEKVIRLVLQEFRRMKEKSPSVSELRRAKDYVVGQMQLSLESTDNRMNWIGEQLLSYGCVISPGEIKRRLFAVTPSSIQDVARDFFRPERLNLSLVSPLKSVRNVSRLLRL